MGDFVTLADCNKETAMVSQLVDKMCRIHNFSRKSVSTPMAFTFPFISRETARNSIRI